MQKCHLIKNKFFDPRLQILFTVCVCEIVNTMVYGKSSKYARYSSCKQCKREKQQKSIVITNVNNRRKIDAEIQLSEKQQSSRKNLYRSGSWLWKYQDGAPGISDWDRVL